MHKFLLAFDGSPSATRALEYLVRLHAEIGAFRVHLVNVQEEPVLFGEVAVYQEPHDLEKLKREHGERLLEPAVAKLAASRIGFTSVVVVGPVAQGIVAEAERAGCDHVVMGSRGMGPIATLLTGSVAVKVLHLVKVPVTLVP